jgi:hypothetical protein
MYYRWQKCPALVLSPTAFAVLSPGGRWSRVSASRVISEGEKLSPSQFRQAFPPTSLPVFPEPFREAGQATPTPRAQAAHGFRKKEPS